MGKIFEDRAGWTIGMEYELNCEVSVRGSFDFMTVRNETGDVVLTVSGDMGGNNWRRVEIATAPMAIRDVTQRQDNVKIILSLMELFGGIAGENGPMPKSAVPQEFEQLQKGCSKKYTCSCLLDTDKLMIRTPAKHISISTQQISFGVPIQDVDLFLNYMAVPWYSPGKFTSGDNASESWKINYALCVMEFLIQLFRQKLDLDWPQTKNKWDVMPRNPLSDLWKDGLQKHIPLDRVLTTFQRKEEDETVIREVYEFLCMGNSVGGKKQSIVRIGDQLVFECRSFGGNLAPYGFTQLQSEL